MQDREKRCPFLEVYIDASIRKHSRRDPRKGVRLLIDKRVAALDVEEGIGIEVGARLAKLL